MSFLDSNFDPYLEKIVDTGSSEQSNQDFDALVDSFSGNKVVGGVLTSANGRSAYNLDDGTFIVNDGLAERARLGVMEDGGIGLRIRDKDGNELLNITGDRNIIQSKTKKMQIDLDEEQARWYDEINLRILIGKAIGLF